MSGSQEPPGAEPFDSALIERRAVQGISLLLVRTLIVQVLTAGATIALARILSPAEYGAFAVALMVQLLGKSAVELGLPVAFIQREQPPTLHEERSLTGIVLVSGTALAGLIASFMFVFLPAFDAGGEVGNVIAIACLALPLWSLRAVPVIQIERHLRFGRLIAIEVTETLSFYLFAVPAALAGLGAYSLAAAVPVSAVMGVIAAFVVQRWRFGLSFDFAAIRPLVGFGAQLSLLPPANYAREFGIVATLIAVGGQALAGFYSMGLRLFSIPIAVSSAVSRVSTAALSRERSGPGRAGRGVRTVGVTAVAVGFPLALVAGSADPLISVLFGERWLPSADLAVAGSAGMLFGVTSSAVVGLSLAEGDATSPMLATITGGVAAVAVAGPLASSLGVLGAGIAASVGAVVNSAVLTFRGPFSARRYFSPVLRTLAALALATAVGHFAVSGTGVTDLLIALGVSGLCYVALALVLCREHVATLVRLFRRHRPGRSAPAPA